MRLDPATHVARVDRSQCADGTILGATAVPVNVQGVLLKT
jgi:hypothetical protein